MQHSGIGSFGKWDGVLILYHGLITKTVYCAALPEPMLYLIYMYQMISSGDIDLGWENSNFSNCYNLLAEHHYATCRQVYLDCLPKQ